MISLFQEYAGYGTPYLVATIAAYLLALLFSLSLHEWAHAFMATKQGDDTPKAFGRLSLNPLSHIDYIGMACLMLFGFGWAKPVPINPLKFKKYRSGIFWVSSAGIIMNLLLVIISSFFYVLLYVKIGEPTTVLEIFGMNFFLLLMIISFSLAIFNLLPIYPLDGFNMVSAFVKKKSSLLEFLHHYGNIIMIVFMVSPIFSYLLTFMQNYVLNPLIALWAMIL